MSLSETRQFLEDLVRRYDPDTDVTEGSRAQTDLIEPILERVGIDPFDEDLDTFVRERIRQMFPTLAITEADDLTDTVIDPLRVLLEPIVREVKLVKLRASLRNIESLSDDEVDSLLGNFFESRRAGGFAIGVVRAYFATPQTVSVTSTSPATTRDGRRFFSTRPQSITADQMQLNQEGTEYYFDINFTAENRGDEYNVEPGEIVSIANLPTATRVKNLRRFRGGSAREGNTDFAARVQRAISDKTLTVERGISATLFENFPALRRLFVVGFRDPEMDRDVVTGGGLGPIPDDDPLGSYFGSASVVDDLDSDLTSPIISAASGNFVTRLGPAGSSPQGWFITLVYDDGTLRCVDARVVQVISNTQIRTDQEIPLSGVTFYAWMLRERKIEVSNIPGGITLPDNADGELEIKKDEVHIGGKTDVYVAGEVEDGTAKIDVLSDEGPVVRGFLASTAGTDVVTVADANPVLPIAPGMSLVLEEGVDAGSYLIILVSGVAPTFSLTLDTAMTGTQSNLAYRIVDEIDVELTDPKVLKVDGPDLLTAAGSDTVTTSSATNFVDATVAIGDTLEVFDEVGGGEFTVTEVGVVSLKVTPVLPRTIVNAAYRVFRRYQAINPPVVRVSGLELLDSAGAPTGTAIPYRDPVLVVSNAFQNEGGGVAFEGLVYAGLVSTTGVTSGSAIPGVGATTLNVEVRDAARAWEPVITTASVTFTAGPLTAAQVASQITTNLTFVAANVRAVALSYGGRDYVGVVADRLITTTAGTALAPLGIAVGETNAQIRGFDPTNKLTMNNVRRTDLLEFTSGNNAGTRGRVITDPSLPSDIAKVGQGPLGPDGTSALYDNLVLRPDVGASARVGRPSVGSSRVFFLAPTSAEFYYSDTLFSASLPSGEASYRPDPENQRILIPAPPRTTLPDAGVTASVGQTLTDSSQNFLLLRVQAGDVLEVLYRPIVGTSPLPTPASIAFTALNNELKLRLDNDPYITVSFPTPLARQDAVDYINERVGTDIASLSSAGNLVLKGPRRIEIDPTSSCITDPSNPLYLAGAFTDTDHPDAGEYIVRSVVSPTVLQLSGSPGNVLSTASVSDTHYRVKRYVQRISSTEMNNNLDASGLYYAEIQMVSTAPGDVNNIGSGVQMAISGHYADGYRLMTENLSTAYSRAEILRAQISPSIILVGSPDSPEEYVQLSQQSVQVSYERSQIADDIQSFCDSDYQRVVVEEILVKHLLPHYVSLNWAYVAGASEAETVRALNDLLDTVEPGEQLEVSDLVNVLRRRGAQSVYTPDSNSSTGRTAPLFLVVYHAKDRTIRGLVVRDFVDSVRTQRFIPDSITVRRVSTGGIR
jgi:hypothetical protein